MKKIVALLLVCVLILGLAACGSSGSGDTKPADEGEKQADTTPSGSDQTTPAGSDQTTPADDGGDAAPAPDESGSSRPLNIAVSEDHGTMLPQAASGTGGMVSVIRAIYEPLIYQRKDGSFENCLASEIEMLEDTHYVIHLREGVVFNNGNPFTAEDVMYTMELYHGHPRHGMVVGYVDFDKTKIVDDYTIDLWLTQYSIIQFPALTQMYIHDAESYNEEELALHPITTGAYEVTDYVVNSHITLEARDDYWGDPPAIKNINFTFMTEDAQRVNALTTGDADIARIPMKDVEYVESLDDYTVNLSFAAQADCAYLNMSKGAPLETLEAREAFMMAIDRQAIVDLVYCGNSSVPNWPIYEYNVDYNPATMSGIDEAYIKGYDPVRAKELAEQSGLVGKTLRIATNGSADAVTMAEMMQYDLEEIGVHAQILTFDQATYFSDLMDASNFDVGIYFIANTIGSAADLFANYPLFFQCGWEGPERDEFLALGQKAITTIDDAERGKILEELVHRFAKVNIWFAISELVNVNAHNVHLAGMEYYLDGSTSYNKWYWTN